jgi:hypothetical protein
VLAFNGNGQFQGISTEPGTVLQATITPTDALANPVSLWIGGNGVMCGTDTICSPIYAGAFDNAYFNSSIPSLAGHMYVCGKENFNTDRPAIYQLSFNSATGALQSAIAFTGIVNGSSEACSPVTEIFNPDGGGPGIGQDLIFFSVGKKASLPPPSSCVSFDGCLISIDVTNDSWPPAAVANSVRLPIGPLVASGSGAISGSTSGIVVDNVSAAGQASSIYFSLGNNSESPVLPPLPSGLPSCNGTFGVGCAIKLTQSGLQ